MKEYGGYDVMNLDGGGSSTLVISKNKKVRLLNSPIQHHRPRTERPVANHFGISKTKLKRIKFF